MTENEAIQQLSKRMGKIYVPIPGTTQICNEHGFLSYVIYDTPNGKALYLEGLYAPNDGQYWDEFTKNLAKENNCKYLVITTIRNPKVIEKKYGYKIHSYTMVKEVN